MGLGEGDVSNKKLNHGRQGSENRFDSQSFFVRKARSAASQNRDKRLKETRPGRMGGKGEDRRRRLSTTTTKEIRKRKKRGRGPQKQHASSGHFYLIRRTISSGKLTRREHGNEAANGTRVDRAKEKRKNIGGSVLNGGKQPQKIQFGVT